MANRKKPGKNIKPISSPNSDRATSSRNGSSFRWPSINGASNASGPSKPPPIDEESTTQEELVEAKYEEWDTALVHACSYHARKLDLKALDQYESRFVRNFDRALRQFNQIREQYPPQSISENEPETQSEPETAPSPSAQKTEIAKVENELETARNVPARRAIIHEIPKEICPSIAAINDENRDLPDFPLVA
jgi:hypothetical protein